MRAFGWAYVAWLTVVVCATGCRPKNTAESDAGRDGTVIESPDDLQPWAKPGDRAELVYGGTNVPVSLRATRNGQNLTIGLYAHDEQLDVEEYRITSKSFALANAAGETYEPPIDVLRFPLRVGDGWDWKGTMTAGGIAKQAVANVATHSDRLFPETVPMDTVKSTVNLEIDANGPNGPKAKRDLVFWFGAGKGVVRREFGAASVRQPVQDTGEP